MKKNFKINAYINNWKIRFKILKFINNKMNLLTLLFCLFFSFTALYCDSNINDIVFKLPDIIAEYGPIDDRIILKAYKSSNNDMIINSSHASNFGKLNWISIGQPKLVTSLNKKKHSHELFNFLPEGFYIYIQMLTNEHRSILQEKINQTYKILVQNNQIVSLIPSRFECKLVFYQDDSKFLLIGKANQFNKLPIGIFFYAPRNSKERKALEKRISEDGSDLNLDFDCEVNKQGQAYRTNTLAINGEQLSQLGIVEDLFGPASEVFVTRNQLQDLASDVYSNLNIMEEYQIAESQFSENFIEDFIKQTASSVLKPVDFEDALSQLSPYKINEDLKPSLIKSELSKMFKINQTDSKSRIVLNNEFDFNSKILNEKFKGSLNWFGGKADYEKQVKDLSISGKSVDGQLKELNLLDKSDIEWKRDGEIIVPKTIKVHRFNQANFSKKLVFKRIKREFYDALYKENFILSTQDVLEKKPMKSHPYHLCLKLTNNDVKKILGVPQSTQK